MSELTPEQQLELETKKVERANAEKAAAEAQERLAERERQERVHREDNVLAEAIRTGPKFHPDRNMLIKLMRDPENGLEFDGDNVTALAGDKRVPLSEFLEFLALEKPYLVDGRSLRGLQRKTEPEKPPTKARSEFKTVSQKVEFINRFGEEAWSKLPMYPTKMLPVDELDLATFRKLPVSLKTQLIAEHGPDFVETLARRGRR
jgi:hypothetical protein